MNSIPNSSVLQYLGDLKRCVLNEKDGMFLMLYLANPYQIAFPFTAMFLRHMLASSGKQKMKTITQGKTKLRFLFSMELCLQ